MRHRGPNNSWSRPVCQEEQKEVRGYGTLGQLVRVKLGMRGRWGNSSGSCIPSAHQAITGAGEEGGKKQELIRGAVKTKKADFAKALKWWGKWRWKGTRGTLALRKTETYASTKRHEVNHCRAKKWECLSAKEDNEERKKKPLSR